jgi:hypothetical protein
MEPDWRAALAVRWQALGFEILGLGPTPRRTLSELARECEAIVVVVALFEALGNITHAAARVGTSRRAFRERVALWRRRYPHFVPRPPGGQPEPRRPKAATSGPKARTRRAKAGVQGSEAGGEQGHLPKVRTRKEETGAQGSGTEGGL